MDFIIILVINIIRYLWNHFSRCGI